MSNPRSIMKRKKQQSIGNLQTTIQYIVDILIILDYDPEYLELYINQVNVLRILREQDSSYSLKQYYEMIRSRDDTIDMGTRYEYLIKLLDLLIDTKLLEQKWFNTLL